jgi:hypothetical protein
VLDVGSEYSLKVATVKDQRPIEALGADRAHEALRDRVCLGRPNRSSQDPDAFAAEDLIEGSRVLGVAVADQEADLLLGEEGAEAARLLGNPASARVGRAACEVNAAGAVLDEEERVLATCPV